MSPGWTGTVFGMSHVVHVGFHKTGSTWLQKDVFPSVVGASYAGNHDSNLTLMRSLTATDPSLFLPETVSGFIRDLGRAFVSYEGLVGSPWGGVDVEELVRRVEVVAAGALVVFVRRDAQEMRRALYSQYVHEGGPDRSFEPDRSYFDFDRTVRLYADRFEVAVFDYDQLRSDPAGFVRAVGERAGVTFTMPERQRLVNPSLYGWRLHTLRMWNRWFRVSPFNPDPMWPLPGGPSLRRGLQRTVRT